MHNALKNGIKGTFGSFLVLLIILAPYSLLIGWNLLTLLLFWFVIIPLVAVYMPTRLSRNQDHLIESLMGLVVFYGFMVFMIYKQYQTDYFQVMIISGVVNCFVVIATILLRRTIKQAGSN